MRSRETTRRRLTRTIALAALVAGILAVPATAPAGPTITLTVTNSGARAIDGLYFSLYTDRGWGDDVLDGNAVTNGGGIVLHDVDCTTASIVAIAEDEAGCFLYRTVSCDADATWTITSSSPRDCGR